jgi:hypothetical protein
VLEEVIRDNKVQTRVGDLRKPFAVIEEVDLNEGFVLKLGIVGAQLRDGQAVDVANPGRARHGQRVMERPDLDSLA